MVSSVPSIVFGTAGIAAFDETTAKQLLSTLEKNDVKYLDTAFLYENSEATLGKYDAPKSFTIHTKAPGFAPKALSKQSVLNGIDSSLKNLGVDSVEIYYLHAPDPNVPIEETLEAIQEIYEAGKFKRFGLSNFKPADVQKIYDIQKSKNGVLPSVFQGNYNAVSRHIESDLFPLLRKLNISFFAYSPIAGGFLVKSSSQLREKSITEGRFSDPTLLGSMYTDLYVKESLLAALDEWEEIAKEAGISKAALAYRWVTYHSELRGEKGDGIIIGASKVAQLEETLKVIKDGPLSVEVLKKVQGIWAKVEKEAPLDNYHSFALQKLV